MRNRAAFTHPRRKCLWCGRGFKPTETLSPNSTEHFCAPECAFARHQARALDMLYPGSFDKAQQAAAKGQAAWAAEVSRRLQDGRNRAKRELSGGG